MRGALHSQFSGAIWNYGTLEMHACSLTANSAMMVCRCRPNLVHAPPHYTMLVYSLKNENLGALPSQMGGAIYNTGTMEMHTCSLTANRAMVCRPNLVHTPPRYTMLVYSLKTPAYSRRWVEQSIITAAS